MSTKEPLQSEKGYQDSKAWPKVAIIVLNWNGWRDTIECLESLQRLTYPDYQIILVDNGSTDDSVERIKAWARGELEVKSSCFMGLGPKPVTIVEYTRSEVETGDLENFENKLQTLPSSQRLILIQNEINLGFAAGNNIGIKYALLRNYPYIVLLNNDTIADPEFLRLLILSLEANPRWMAISPKILYKDDPVRIWYAGGKLKLWRANISLLGINQEDGGSWSGMYSTEFLTGACLIARRSLFETVGLLDEDFFFGNEDVAYSCIAKRHGLLLGVNLDAKIYHKVGGIFRRENPIHIYYSNKNRLLVLKKCGSLVEQILGFSFYALTRPIKFCRWIGRGKINLVRAELQAIRDFFAGRYGDWDRKQVNHHK